MTLAEVAERMEIDAPALSRLETGKMLNPMLGTLHKWPETLGKNWTLNSRLHEFLCCTRFT
jgi:transcriptional regulator with XRE-family HTH domain